MTQNWTKRITTKMKMTKNCKKYVYQRYYKWLYIYVENISWILKLSMTCNIGVANFVHT